jgi:sensor domain CHASE-containing protein
MKKIILSILILAGIISLHSCREQDEDQVMDMQIQNKASSMKETNKDTDSTNITVLTDLDGTLETDPPPKDGGQWKTRK